MRYIWLETEDKNNCKFTMYVQFWFHFILNVRSFKDCSNFKIPICNVQKYVL